MLEIPSSSRFLILLFSLGFDLDFTHSNIEDFGISFGTNFNIRNIFRGTENLSVNLNNRIGASRDIGDPNDSFFNLFELGGNLNLRIPRAVLPFKSYRLIKKEMNPVTNFIIGSTFQKNIGFFFGKISPLILSNRCSCCWSYLVVGCCKGFGLQ